MTHRKKFFNEVLEAKGLLSYLLTTHNVFTFFFSQILEWRSIYLFFIFIIHFINH